MGRSCGTTVNGQFIESRTALCPRDHLILRGTTLQFDVRYEATEAAKPVADHALLRRGARADVWFRGEPSQVVECFFLTANGS